MPTKASKLRDEHVKQQKEQMLDDQKNQFKPQWKLRQFLGVGPSEDIAESIKRIKKHGMYLLLISSHK